ncbi:MAG TPA: hypothetical protein VHW73_03830 [Rudaea sp.]|nr:hypothetical protein [Rudaea sp.]
MYKCTFERSLHIALFGILVCSACDVAAAEFPMGDYARGQEAMHFGKDHQFKVNAGKDMFVVGSYVIEGDQITFTDEKGPMACDKAQAKGNFHWSFADNKMSFVKIDDACKERTNDLTAGAWMKK